MRRVSLSLTVGLFLLTAFALSPLALAEVVQQGPARVTFEGELSPKSLPRARTAPVRAFIAARISPSKAGKAPRLRTMTIAINRAGIFSPGLFPTCTLRDIQPSTTENALAACRDSLIGEGHFAAKVLLAQQAAFPASGKLYAFNGRWHGKPAILAHVYGTDPIPTSFTLPFEITTARGAFGTVLRAVLPAVTGKSGYITDISLDLGRTTGAGKNQRSYLSASCPAPSGFPGAVFPFAQASFGFGGTNLTSTLTRNCKVRR